MRRIPNTLNNIEEVSSILKDTNLSSDIITFLCGTKLGKGIHRDVYIYNPDPSYVIKLERDDTEANITEYLVWKEVQYFEGNQAWVKDWLAPVLYCSANGRVLVQKRTYWKHTQDPPDKVPEFLTDIKPSNFGWIGKKFVCHDYGFLHSFTKFNKVFKKALW